MKENFQDFNVTQNSGYTNSIFFNNPVFKIKLIKTNNKIQQKRNQKIKNNEKLHKGDYVIGIPLKKNKLIDKNNKQKGIIDNIIKDDNGNIITITIINKDSKKIDLDPSSVKKIKIVDNKKIFNFENWNKKEFIITNKNFLKIIENFNIEYNFFPETNVFEILNENDFSFLKKFFSKL